MVRHVLNDMADLMNVILLQNQTTHTLCIYIILQGHDYKD